MTRFQVRRKLRKACSKAKYVALRTLSIRQTSVSQGRYRLSTSKVSLKTLSTCLGGSSVALMVLGTVSIAQAAVLDTRTSSTAIPTLDSKQSFGETFTVGQDNVMNQLGLYAFNTSNVISNVRLSLQSWDGTKPTGSLLFDQIIRIPAQDQKINILQFNTEIALERGKQYVAFATTDNPIGVVWSQKDQNSNPGGYLVINSTSPTSQTSQWRSYPNYDLAITAAFSVAQPVSKPVPEPLTILGSLAAGSFGVTLRCKYNKQEQKDTTKV
ncbi:MAG: PEP-CTERM sorting domain-containing protein [Rhizonema sp. PD38]|nr:PEP-CTERM sorting domain-containing protein [Rhizonema sp. PD38]